MLPDSPGTAAHLMTTTEAHRRSAVSMQCHAQGYYSRLVNSRVHRPVRPWLSVAISAYVPMSGGFEGPDPEQKPCVLRGSPAL